MADKATKRVKNKFTTVSIPEPLGENIREFIKDTGFTSMSDFVTFVLREILSERANTKKAYKRDEDEIIRKLKALGYIN